MKKRGLSPVIATVLLIVLVMVIAAIIFAWARGFISEQIEKFGQPIEKVCEDVSMEIDLKNPTGGYTYELQIANRGNVDIKSFDIKEVRGGDSEIKNFKFSVDVGKALKKEIDVGPEVDTIFIYPSLLGSVKGKSSNKIFTCLEHGKQINLK